MTFSHLGIGLKWKGKNVNEKGILHGFNAKQFEEVTKLSASDFQLSRDEVLIEVDPAYFRPTEVELLIGDPTKSKEKLGWEPKYDLQALLEDMMQADVELFKKDIELKAAGHKVLRQAE
jgi:GDPmannose 4,6-dehydratase